MSRATIKQNGFIFEVEYTYQPYRPQTLDYEGDSEYVEIEEVYYNGSKIKVNQTHLNNFSQTILNLIHED